MSSSSHAIITYTFVFSDDDLPSWGIPLMEAYEPEVPLSPVHALVYLEYLAPSDDDIAPTEDQLLPTGVRKARKTVRPQPPLLPSIAALIEEWRNAPIPSSPSPSLLSPLSSSLPKIPSPSLLLASPTLTAAARLPGSTLARCTELDFMTALEEVKESGTEVALGLAQWFEKMESVFHISKCIVEWQVKFSTCTILGGALTWWNSHVRIVGHDAAYALPWKTLMKMMTENYYPRSELKKLETELWNLVMKATDIESYTQCFHELILLCLRMVPDELDKVQKYTSGFPDSIQRSVMASKPKTLQEAIELTRSLMD
nr:reverse transcriptase domain-containing protein [Tanacetum cinerariifolium]